jgi:MoaA/NifB/PqqE/SkfB family radical SAM enzyme
MFAQRGSENSVLLEEHDERITALPILVLCAHNRCNCRCLMCDIWKREEDFGVTAADLERHRESLRRLSVEWVVLSGGEPLMNQALHALCTFFRELNIRLSLLTTGLLLKKRAAQVASLFDDVIVSIDGPQSIHDNIRRVKGGFELIRSGVAAVHAVRPEMKITVRTTVQKLNHASLRETVRTVKELGLGGISFLAADVTSEAFNRPLLWPGERQSEVALSNAEVRALEDEVEKLIAEFSAEIRSGYVADGPAKLRRIVASFKAHLGQGTPQSPQCNAPWVSAVIEADGGLRPCFFHRVVGNIGNATIEEVVNSDMARAFRRDLNVETNPVCRRCVCSLYRSNPSPRNRGN